MICFKDTIEFKKKNNKIQGNVACCITSLIY